MSEAYGLQFNVDASGIARGLDAYKSAVSGIGASLKAFEAQATKTFTAVNAAATNKSNLSSFAKSMQALGKIDIDATAARKITQLSTAIGGFKAPTSAQTGNVSAFFRALSRMPEVAGAEATARAITQLSRSMAGFRAPSAAQAANLTEFANAVKRAMPGLENVKGLAGLAVVSRELAAFSNELKNVKAPSAGQITNLGNLALALKQFNTSNLTNASHIGTALAGISGFKAPSAAQIKNLENFIHALNSMKVPTNGAAIASQLNMVASASARMSASMGGLRSFGSASTSAFKGVSEGAHSASLNMMGLQNAFSGTFQAASVLRSLLGSLTLGELGRSFFTATQAMNAFEASMQTINQSPFFSAAMWQQVSADANHFGADLLTYADGFSKFAAAANQAGASVAQTEHIWTGFQTVMTSMHLGTEQQQSVGLALREMLDRGYVSSQQLTRQLGMVLPGAVKTLDAAVKEASHGQINLQDALKKKMIDSTQALLILSDYYKKEFGPGIAQALQSPTQQFNILKNDFTQMMVEIGNAGAKSAFANLLAQISGYLDPSKVKGFADAIGHGVTSAVNSLSAAVAWLHDNWASIKEPLATAVKLFSEWMALSAALSVGRSILSPLAAIRGGFLGMSGAITGTVEKASVLKTAYAGLTAGNQSFMTGLAGLNVRGQAAIAGFNAMNMAGNGLRGMFNGLLSLVGGPVGLAFIGVTAAIYAATSAWQRATAANAEASRIMASGNSVMEETNKLLGQTHQLGIDAAGSLGGVGNYAGSAAGQMETFAGKTGDAATQLRNLAQATRDAGIAKINAQIADIDANNKALNLTTTQGAHDDLYKRKKTGLGDWFGSYFNDRGRQIDNWFGFNNDKQAASEITSNLIQRTNMVNARDQLARQSDEQIAKNAGLDGGATGDTRPLLGAPQDKNKNKKDKAFSDEKAFETQLTDFLNSLSADDSVAKITKKWNTDILNGAKALLGPGGFAEAIKTIGGDSTTAAAKAQGLINAIQHGALTKVAIKGLQEAGMTPDMLVTDLKKWIADQDQKIEDALVKEQTDKYKNVDKLMKSLAEKNPVLKVQVDAQSDLLSQAGDMLNSTGMQAYIPVIDQLHQGVLTATQATQALINLLNTAGDTKDGIASIAPQLTKYLNDQAVARQRDARAAQEEITFGAKVIKTLQDQYDEMQLSTKQQQTFKDLQEAINDLKKAGLDPTQKMIDQTKAQIEAQEKLNDTLQRQKELHDNNGIRQWAADTMQAQDVANNVNKDLASGLETTLDNIFMTGRYNRNDLINIFKSIQGDVAKYASQLATKQLLNFINPHSFNKDGSMNANANPDATHGVLGRLLGVKKGGLPMSKDQWAGMSDAKNNPNFDPQWNNDTGLITAFKDDKTGQMKSVATQAQPMVTALKTVNKYNGNGAQLMSMDPSDTHSPINAAYDQSNTALRVNVVAGLPGSKGGAGASNATPSNPLGLNAAGSAAASSPIAAAQQALNAIDPSTLQASPIDSDPANLNGIGDISADGSTMAVKMPDMSGLMASVGVPAPGSASTSSGGMMSMLGLGGSSTIGSTAKNMGMMAAMDGIGTEVGNMIGGKTGSAVGGFLSGGLLGGLGGLFGGKAGQTAGVGLSNMLSLFTGAGSGAGGGLMSLLGLGSGGGAGGLLSMLGLGGTGSSGGLLSMLGLGGGGGAGGILSMLGLGGGTTAAVAGAAGVGSDATDLLSLVGLFREGGISGQAVGFGSAGFYGSGFANAPHFAEGTPHTGNFAGGMPAVLHQNEAVVPLSRGRSIPIEFSGNGAMGASQQTNHNITFNVSSPNPDTFQKSQSQMATQAYAISAKAARRNGTS